MLRRLHGLIIQSMDLATNASTNASVVAEEEKFAQMEDIFEQDEQKQQTSLKIQVPLPQKKLVGIDNFHAFLANRQKLPGLLSQLNSESIVINGNKCTVGFLMDNFFCGCGKIYYNRSSLSNHIVQRHSGAEQKGTIVSKKQKINFLEDNANSRLMSSMNSYKPNKLNRVQKDIFKELVNPRRLLIFKNYSSLVKGICNESVITFPNFVTAIKKARKQILEQLTYHMTIDSVMGLFLRNLCQIVNESFLQNVQEILIALRVFINKNIHNKVKEFFLESRLFFVSNQKMFITQQDYCSTNTCEYLPLVYKEFTTKSCQQSKVELMEQTVLDFCDWIYENRLTQIRILNNLNVEHDLVRKIKFNN